MTDIQKPRKGSMAHRPRKRAKSQNPNVHWEGSEEARVLGFAGYKAGMTHVAYVDDSDSPTKGQEIVDAVTVVEVPPMTVYGVRCYRNGHSCGDILAQDEKVLKQAGFSKKPSGKAVKEDEVDDARLLVFASPSRTKIGKKHIEKMELGCGGKDAKEKLEYCKGLLGKELKLSEVFKSGEHVDIISVTKGKGWQGPVKRFGTSIQRRKATGKRRHVGTLGQWHPPYVFYTIPQAGQMGYHKRTELNKRILRIGQEPDEVNPKEGFQNYGFVGNEYVMLKGSIPGPAKRLVKMRLAVRSKGAPKEAQLNYVER